MIESHGRNKDGKLDRARYRFFGMDVAGTSPSITLTVPGYTTKLLDQMLVAANWATPNSDGDRDADGEVEPRHVDDASLAPLAGGTNIEGLAWPPTAARPNQLLIGFRSPAQGTSAIVVSLLNATDVLTGATAQFGEAALLDLGGLGIRGDGRSPPHNAVLLIAGPPTTARVRFVCSSGQARRRMRPSRCRTSRASRPARRPKRLSPTRTRATSRSCSTRAITTWSGDACKDASSSREVDFGATLSSSVP